MHRSLIIPVVVLVLVRVHASFLAVLTEEGVVFYEIAAPFQAKLSQWKGDGPCHLLCLGEGFGTGGEEGYIHH